MLAVAEQGDAVRRLARGEVERIAAPAHQRIGAQHGAQLQRAIADRPAGHAHRHAGDEGHLIAARPFLPVIDAVQHQMAHQGPVAGRDMHAAVLRGVRLPGGAGGFAAYPIGAERARHRCRAMRGVPPVRHPVVDMVNRRLRPSRWLGLRLGLGRRVLPVVSVLGECRARQSEDERGGAKERGVYLALRSRSWMSSLALRRCSPASPPVMAASMQWPRWSFNISVSTRASAERTACN